MGGTPVFGIARENMKMCEITEIKGILNSTTNFVLQGIEQGKDLKEILAEKKMKGLLETNIKNDLEGNEAAAKLVALTNAMMGAEITPDDIKITGIDKITKTNIDEAASRGNVIKMMCRACKKDDAVTVTVSPEEVSKTDVFATVEGTSTAISITSDLMGTMTIIEESPQIEQSGYGVFADLLTIIKDM